MAVSLPRVAQLQHLLAKPLDICNMLDCPLSGPVRDTPPYRAIPFRDSIAEGGIAGVCLVFIGYRASIAEIPLLWFVGGGYRTSTLHALQGGNAPDKKGEGVSHPIGHVETAKTP